MAYLFSLTEIFWTDTIYNHTEFVGFFFWEKDRKYNSNLSLAQHLKYNVGKLEACSAT